MTEKKRLIYRKINGELIRIPQRDDLHHRYSTRVDTTTGEVYDLEFTEEEECQRDQEEAQRERERPERETEQKRREEEAIAFRKSLAYKDRIVAYLDILGWRSAIQESVNNPETTQHLGITLKSIQDSVQLVQWMQQHGDKAGWPGDPQMTQFSDSILISIEIDQYQQESLVFYLRLIVTYLLQNRMLVRGGIAKGLLIHENSIVYGPALIAAYDLEQKQKEKNKPRIALSEELAVLWNIDPKIKNWKRDSDDNICFFNCLQPLSNIPDHQINGQVMEAFLKPIQEFTIQGLEKYKNDDQRTYKKYHWFAVYINDILKDYPKISLNINLEE